MSQDSNNNLSNFEKQRVAAANLVRQKVLESYKIPESSNTHLKYTPKVITASSDATLKKYHSAWQDYYQKYYSDYYSTAAKKYIEQERQKDINEIETEKEILQAMPNENSRITELENIIHRQAEKKRRKSRRKRHLMPIFAGMFVVLFILFLQYNRLIFAPIMAYISPGEQPASEIESVDPTVSAKVSSDPRLIIPKLNIDVPINFNLQLSQVMSAMNNGVAHYRIAGASAYPGQNGNFVITGHSAGDIYSNNQYKYIFSGLERLDDGDLIYVNYLSVRYTYKITKKQVVEPTNVSALNLGTAKPFITLVTCTPLGTSRYRLLVTGEQIAPVIDDAAAIDQKPVETTNNEVMPANEPTFFEGIWNWLTGN